MNKVFLSFAIVFLSSFILEAQTVFYNEDSLLTVDAGAIVYVDGDVVNATTGRIRNSGDVYLTGNWDNANAAGCLNPTTGTVYLDGTTQTIMGTQTTTFNNLDCQNGNTKTINITTVVGGNTGILSLNSSAFDLNSNTLIVTNSSNGAVTRTSGYIVSETDPAAGYGIVQWNLGNSIGNYVYPFGTIAGGYIPFIYNATTAGAQSTTGNIAVATYPTGVTAMPNNRPLPNTVTNLTDPSTSAEAAPVCADRFWPILANNYTTEPTADVTFTYEDSEWDNSGGSTNTIVEDSLSAWRWNGTQWQLPTVGIDNPIANTVFAPGVSSISSPWTLKGAPPCAVTASVTTTTTIITLGDNIQITASGGGTYLWNTIPTQTSPVISVSPTSTTIYCVTVTDTSTGCTDSACVTINVELPCGDFFLPTAFSPNGDNKNDYFRPRSICIRSLEMKIYNRWGNLVFETTDVNTKGWDGSTIKGAKEATQEVFVYQVIATMNDGKVHDLKGNVTLMR